MTAARTPVEASLLPDRFRAGLRSAAGLRARTSLNCWRAGRDGRSVLLIAPTGGGKTLAGFLPTLVELSQAQSGERPQALPASSMSEAADGISGDRRRLVAVGRDVQSQGGLHTLYISPLKALAVDIARNLETRSPRWACRSGIETRTGDTPHQQAPAPAARSARHPAHHAGATGAAAGQRRCALSVRRAQARRARRTACAGHLQARRSAFARPGPAVAAGARPRRDRPVGDRRRAGRSLPVPGAAAGERHRRAPTSSSPKAAPSRTSRMLDTWRDLPWAGHSARHALGADLRADQAAQDDAGVRQHPQPGRDDFPRAVAPQRGHCLRSRCTTARSTLRSGARSRTP